MDRLVDDFKPLACYWHDLAWLTTDASALPAEGCPMNPTPILQRTIAFALSGSELGTDLLEWHYLDS